MKNTILKALVAGLAFLPFIGNGQNLVRNDAENWAGTGKSSLSPQAGTESFETSDPIFNSEEIPVDKMKNYILSGWFKNNGDTHFQYIYFSLMPLDADKKQINAIEFNAYPMSGDETVLVAPCSAESSVLKIKDGAKWKESRNACIAFNAETPVSLKIYPIAISVPSE